MKKLLFLFVCINILVSCSEEADPVMEMEQQVSADEKASMDAATKTIGFMDPTNRVPLYEYTWNNTDYYYAAQFLGASFYDSKTGRNYQYVREIGKIGKNLYPYYGHISVIEKLALFYNPTAKTHRAATAPSSNPDHFDILDGHTVKVRDLGWILYQLHNDDRYHLSDGSWKYFNYYKHTTTNALRIDYNELWGTNPDWSFRQSLGYCVIR